MFAGGTPRLVMTSFRAFSSRYCCLGFSACNEHTAYGASLNKHSAIGGPTTKGCMIVLQAASRSCCGALKGLCLQRDIAACCQMTGLQCLMWTLCSPAGVHEGFSKACLSWQGATQAAGADWHLHWVELAHSVLHSCGGQELGCKHDIPPPVYNLSSCTWLWICCRMKGR